VFVTAHAAGDNEPDWAALAKSGLTLVVYMGVARCAAVQRALLAGDLPGTTPVLVVQDASLPRERQLRTTLAQLSADAITHEIASPAVIVIGEVARVRSEVLSGEHALIAS
jgi:uroporphyrin-III C-methyltransferase